MIHSTRIKSKLNRFKATDSHIFGSLPEGALRSNSEEYRASYITEPDDVNGIKEAIKSAYFNFKENKLPVPSKEFIDGFRRDHLTEILSKELQFFIKDNQ